MNLKTIFGGTIAVILLGLYSYSVLVAIQVVVCASAKDCTDTPMSSFTSGFSLIMTTVGALVSALVIAELSITNPQATPTVRLLADGAGPTTTKVLTILTIIYLAIWVIVGLAALVFGVMLYPDVLADLTNLGKAWIGIAVASVYAYFGVKPAA